MKKLLYLATLSVVATLFFATAAVAQEEVACPAGEVNVLTDDGFICVPENVENQTPAETDAVTNDPRSNAETPIVENQEVSPEQDTSTGGSSVYCPEGGFPATPPGSPGEGGLQCFDTKAEADAYSNGETTTPEPTQPQAASCSGFASQFGAQQYYDFNATAEEQAILDADGDGFACDELETGVDNLGETDADRGATGDQYETPETPTTSETPTDTDDTVLPDTGGASLLLPAAGLLLATGLIGLAIVRRRS